MNYTSHTFLLGSALNCIPMKNLRYVLFVGHYAIHYVMYTYQKQVRKERYCQQVDLMLSCKCLKYS